MVSLNLLYWASGIIIVLIFVMVIYFLQAKFFSKREPWNETLFINFMPQYTKGHSIGVITDIHTSEKRTGISFYPRDINYIKMFRDKKKQKLKEYKVFFENNKLIALPEGMFSSHRNILIGLPPREEEVPYTLKNHPFGKMIMNMMAENNKDQEQEDVLRKRLENQKQLLYKTEGLDILNDFMELNKEMFKQVIKTTRIEQPRGFIPPSPGGGS